MRKPLGRNVAANLLNGLAGSGLALLYIPLIIAGVGTGGLGVWTLAQTMLIYATVAESGVGPAIARFSAVAAGAGDTRSLVRLLWSALGLYTVIGLALTGIAFLAAPAIVDLFDVPAVMREDAIAMFRLVGPAMLLALLTAGLGNVQYGLERFVAFAVTNAVGALAFLAVTLFLFADGASLVDLGWAAIAQQATAGVARVWSLRDVIAAARPGVVGRLQLREIVSFSARLQMSVLSTLVNNQTDKVVIGVVAPVTTLGQAGIAAQVSEASRLVVGSALGPLVSRMAVLHGSGDVEGLGALFKRINRLWLFAVCGVTVVGVATIHPIITGWLGPDYELAALLGGILVVAYGINMLTGAGTSYLRATGHPGLEARYGTLLIVLNLALTPPLGIIFGAVGVVGATALTYLIGTAWFMWRLQRLVGFLPPDPWRVGVRATVGAALAGVLALAWGLAVVEVVPTGLALIPVLAGAGAAFAAYLSWVTRVWPTPANLRALLA